MFSLFDGTVGAAYHLVSGFAMTLAPQVMALRQRHARQPDRLQRELAELYRREGTGAIRPVRNPDRRYGNYHEGAGHFAHLTDWISDARRCG
jgi:hypothetical protein